MIVFMGIITISRELAALGDETARELAKLTGYRLIDKKMLEERIKSFGVEDSKFKKYDERKPSFFASLSQDRDYYLHYLKTAIFTEAEQGNCVFIGRGAGMVLRNIPAHISIFLAAPTEIRIERVKSYFHCDQRRARQIIERGDQDRIGFQHYFFDIDWKDPGNYHLSLNTGTFSPAVCAELIKNMGNYIFTPETEAKNAVCLKEMLLEQKIKHKIVYEQNVPIHFPEVSVSGNIVTIYGVANSQALVDTAMDAVREMDNSIEVRSEIQIVSEYSVMP